MADTWQAPGGTTPAWPLVPRVISTPLARMPNSGVDITGPFWAPPRPGETPGGPWSI